MTVPKPSLGQKAVKSVNNMDKKLNSNCGLAVLIISTAVIFGAVLYFNFLAAKPSMSHGLFVNGISNVSKMFPLDITPAGWAFSIWGIIYLLQFAWILYSLGLLCRITDNGPAYLNPMVLSAPFFIFFNLTSICNITWLFAWDKLMFFASFLFLLCQLICLYLAVASVAGRIVKFRETLVDEGRSSEVTFLNIAVLNGVSMYATWVTIATLLNLGTVLVYKISEPVSDENACTICLGILSFFAVTYIALDMSFLEMYTRYSVAPYFVLTWALAAIINKNWNLENPSSIFAAVLLGAVSLATLIKLVLVMYKAKTQVYQYRQMRMGRS